MDNLEQKVVDFLKSESGDAVKTLIAFAVNKTKTDKDDEILEDISDVIQIVADNIGDINEKDPSNKEAIEAVMILLKVIVESTETKWDDRIYSMLKIFL